jgi:hypothetical protein
MKEKRRVSIPISEIESTTTQSMPFHFKKRPETTTEFFKSTNFVQSVCNFFTHAGQWINVTHFLVEDWCMSAMLGIIMAFCSVTMDYWIEHLQLCKCTIIILGDATHLALLGHVVLFNKAEKISAAVAFVSWTGYLLVLVLASTLIVHYVAPSAIGNIYTRLR